MTNDGPTPVDIQEALSGLSVLFYLTYIELGGERIGTMEENWRQEKGDWFDQNFNIYICMKFSIKN